MTDTLTKPNQPHSQTHTEPTPTLENPYKAIDTLGCGPGLPGARINSIVDATTINMLMSMHPRPPGVIKTTINIIYDKLIRELKRRGITSIERQSDFIKFMRDCEIGLPGELLPGEPSIDATRPTIGPLPDSAAARSQREAVEPTDRRGTSTHHSEATGVQRQPSTVQPTGQQQKQPVVGQGGSRGRGKGVAQDRSV